MDIQRVRNLTTCILHTKLEHIYKDIEFMVGEEGLMTHMIPNANTALKPFLQKRIPDARFWDGAYDITHTGDIELVPLTPEEKEQFWKAFASLKSPLFG
jgi:hypothetical protein